MTNRRGETVRLTNRDWVKLGIFSIVNLLAVAAFAWTLHEDIAVLKVEMTSAKQEQSTVREDLRELRTLLLRNFEVSSR